MLEPPYQLQAETILPKKAIDIVKKEFIIKQACCLREQTK